MIFTPRSKPAIAAVAAIAAPLPLHAIGRGHHSAGAAQPRPPHTTTVSHPTPHTTSPAPAGTPAPPPAAARAAAKRAVRHTLVVPIARAAGAASDTISDFKFTPASITIHVGDTITWTNNGPTAHTATANDGSFNTGVLAKGASASHTFTQAGTIAYICSLHPFMKGTVVVVANASSSGSGSSGSSGSTGSGSSGSSGSSGGSSGSSSTPSSTSTSSNTSATLPNTGLDLLGTVITALGLLGAGLLLRRRSRDEDVIVAAGLARGATGRRVSQLVECAHVFATEVVVLAKAVARRSRWPRR